jgi:hypothetical protein|tara:strand:- start:632 stop:880 length:249 start_codon:yes stop_codon:yes gene_type:complete
VTKLSLFCLISLLLPSADGVNISKFQSLLYAGINKKNRHMREGKHPVLLAKFYSSNEATSIHENMPNIIVPYGMILLNLWKY